MDKKPIWFRGSPGGLAAVVGDAGVVRIRLPGTTPPGRHETEVNVGDKTYPAVLEVDENLDLDIIPDLLRLSGAAGDVIIRELTILNKGNVPVEVPRAAGFGLFEQDGLERAIGEAFKEKTGEGILGAIAEGTREAHGGLVRMHIDEGAGTLAPGESRDVRVAFHLPDGIRSTRVYTGTWKLYDINYYVEVRGTKKETGAQS